MVMLSAMTVEDEGYEVEMDEAGQVEESGDDGGDVADESAVNDLQDGEQLVCHIPSKPIKILLAKDISEFTHVDEYRDGANVDAWIDRGGDVFVLIDNGGDVCFLEAEEYELLETEAAEVESQHVTIGGGLTWEAEALADIKRARLRVAMMEGRYLEAKERAKDCKADWEAAVNELTAVIDTATKPMPLFDRPPAIKESAESTGDDDDADIANRWREIPIDEICFGIKGMGVKKLEAMRDAIPTLGAFEDLRKKASLDGNPLREYMPKGIGQEACDQLEEAALNRISKEYGSDDDKDNGDDDEADVDDDDDTE